MPRGLRGELDGAVGVGLARRRLDRDRDDGAEVGGELLVLVAEGRALGAAVAVELVEELEAAEAAVAELVDDAED